MYKQSINQIKAVILPLDGTIFDLNRYRYNYYHHFCDSKKVSLTKEEFYNHLCNMYDMYEGLPLSSRVDIGPLNARIEREMLQYLQYKGLQPKEGLLELIEYLHQKEIPIAVISTHRTKDAVNYLKMAQIYHKVHFIIGSDTTCLPLPSTQMLEAVTKHFQIKCEDVLVVSSFMALNKAAYQLHMNIIYCEDLMKAGLVEKETSYKTVSNLFEVLNTLLFDQYETVDIYSPILGMNAQMTKQELDQKKEKLNQAYHDDQQIIDLVDRTYAYHISKLQESSSKDTPPPPKESKPTSPSVSIGKKRFTFNDEEEPLDSSQKELPQEDYKNEIHIQPLKHEEEDELTSLLQQINHKDKPKSSPIKVTDYQQIQQIVEESQFEEDDEDEDQEESLMISLLIDIFYILALSFLILFIGIIIYVAFIHDFHSNHMIFSIISQLFQIYYHIIEACFSAFFNGLHQIISFIPTYHDYSTANTLFSVEGVKLLNIFIFNALFIGIIKIILLIIDDTHHTDKNKEE